MMAGMNIEDVSKVFGHSKNRAILESIKRNAVVVRRLFELCVCANIIPRGMYAMTRKSIMNEICRSYGFNDFEDAEQATLKELEVFNNPIPVEESNNVNWEKAIRNANYSHTAKEVESAMFVSNKLFRFVLAQGFNYDLFNTLLNFRGFPFKHKNIYIQNRDYSSSILSSKHLYWELIILNVSQLAYGDSRFNATDLSITIGFDELGTFNPDSTNIIETMKSFPEKLRGGVVKIDEQNNLVTFSFSKKVLSRIQYKSEKKSFIEVLCEDTLNGVDYQNA